MGNRRLDRRRRLRASTASANGAAPEMEFIGSPREQWLERTAPERRKADRESRQEHHIEEARRRQKAARPARIEWPWSLPKGMRPTGEMTPQELQDEARSQRPLLKKMGFRDSAIFHAHVIKIQYLRAAGYLGWLGVKPYLLALVWIVFGSAFMAATIWALAVYGFSLEGGQNCAEGVTCISEEAQQSEAIAGWAGLIVGIVVGILGSSTTAVSSLAFSRFDTAYAPNTIVQAKYRDEQRKTGREVVALTEVPLLRLATVTDQENRYIGEEGKNSFGKGRSLLETTKSIAKITHVQDFYDAIPHRSTWTGQFASSTHSWYNLAGQAGRLDRLLKNKRKDKKIRLDPIGNYGLLILLASVGIAFLMILTGFDSHSYLKENLPYD